MKREKKKRSRLEKREKKPSIRSKIMLRMSLTVLVALLVSGGISAVMSYNSTTTLLEDTMAQTIALASERVSYELEAYSNIAWETGCVPRLADSTVSVEEKQELIDQRVASHGFQRGNVLGPDGRSIFNGTDYSDRVYFQEAIKGNPYVSEPIVSKQTGELTIIIAAPLWRDGIPNSTAVGVVYFVPAETFLNDIMASIQVSANSSAYIINKNGTVIAHQDINYVIDQENAIEKAKSDSSLAGLAALEQDAMAGNSGFGTYKTGNLSRFLAYAPIADTDGWAVAIAAPQMDFTLSAVLSIIIIAVITVVALLVALLIARRLSISIGDPLNACAERLRTLSQGDLHSPMPSVHTKDEVGMLVQASTDLQTNMRDIIADIGQMMREMSGGNFAVTSTNREAYQGDYTQILQFMDGLRENMCQTLIRISAAADQVDSGSEQVAVSAQALSDGATQQASSIQELAASVNEINGYVQETDRITDEAQEKMEQTNEMTLKCNLQMKDMLSAMDDISRASEEIGKIIKTIEDIAFQTNILALNAAVEAARAGASGKGFAVVADEVRNLAAKSAEASQSTAALIDASTSAVRRGAGLADETARQLQSVADAAQAVDKLVSDIADSARKQAAAVEQVTGGIDQISSVVQTNSATAEESAAASEELAGQAAVLKEQISRFHLSASIYS